MFCTQCGAKFEDGMAFCPSCGARLTSDQNLPQQPQYQQPTYQPQVQQTQNRAALIDSLRHDMRGESAWYIVAGVLCSIGALIYLLIAIFRSSNAVYIVNGVRKTGDISIFFYILSIPFIIIALVDFIYAGKLRCNSRELDEFKFIAKCTSPAPIVMGVFFSLIAMIYAIVIHSKARKLE